MLKQLSFSEFSYNWKIRSGKSLFIFIESKEVIVKATAADEIPEGWSRIGMLLMKSRDRQLTSFSPFVLSTLEGCPGHSEVKMQTITRYKVLKYFEK